MAGIEGIEAYVFMRANLHLAELEEEGTGV